MSAENESSYETTEKIKEYIDVLASQLEREKIQNISSRFDEIKLYLNHKIGKNFQLYEEKRRKSIDILIYNENQTNI